MTNLVTMTKKGPFYITVDKSKSRRFVSIGIVVNNQVKYIYMYYYSLYHMYCVAKTKLWIAKMYLTPWPVYYMVDSTDCDMYRVVSARKAKNGYQYFKESDDIFYNAEGQTSVWVITREEYENHETTIRDYIMEAYEDGHPHMIYR